MDFMHYINVMKYIYEERKLRLINEENDEDIGYISFERKNDVLIIISTVVYEKYQGKGMASTLIKEILEYAKNNDLKIKPLCSFVVHYLEKHPEYKSMVN